MFDAMDRKRRPVSDFDQTARWRREMKARASRLRRHRPERACRRATLSSPTPLSPRAMAANRSRAAMSLSRTARLPRSAAVHPPATFRDRCERRLGHPGHFRRTTLGLDVGAVAIRTCAEVRRLTPRSMGASDRPPRSASSCTAPRDSRYLVLLNSIFGVGAVIDLGADPDAVTQARAFQVVALEYGGRIAGGAAWPHCPRRIARSSANRTATSADIRSDDVLLTRFDAAAGARRPRRAAATSMWSASDIRSTLALKREFQLDLVLVGASEGWLVANEIAAPVPVIADGLDVCPPTSRNWRPRRATSAGW